MRGARSYLVDVISGRRSDAAALGVRALLAGAVPFYRVAVALRNRHYDRSPHAVHHAAVPVISIGNLTTGGTGKTPLVGWVVRELRGRGAAPAILSRGYRSLDAAGNDEKRMLDRVCPGVPHYQNPDRVASAARAIGAAADVLVLDDGFQHRRLHRDLDVVLIDAVNPWGYGRLLPRGLLREPRTALRRAQLIVITRADLCSPDQLHALHRAVSRRTDAPVAHAAFRPAGLVNAAEESSPLSQLSQHRWQAFCGIGNPAGFEKTLAALGTSIGADLLPFPDHHHYTQADIDGIVRQARDRGATALLTTEKDLAKVHQARLADLPLWALRIDVAFTHDGASVQTAIENVLALRHVTPQRLTA
jgi:tetraacyldisaccharide 4'-kinase